MAQAGCFARALRAGLGATWLAGAALAQAVPPPEPAPAPAPASRAVVAASLLVLAELAETDPAAALEEVRRLLASGDLAGDLRATVEVNALGADLLVRLGRPAEAAPIYLGLGFAVQGARDALGLDPVAYWRQAAAAFVAAGDPIGALEPERAILADLRDGAAAPDRVAEVEARIEALFDAARAAPGAGLGDGGGGKPTGGDMGAGPDAGDGETTALPPPVAEAPAPSTAPAPGEPTFGAPPTAAPAGPASDEPFTRVPVYYATDRARTGETDPGAFYGPERGDLDYGIAEVTIPLTHVAGAIEAPSVFRLEFAADPARHVILQSVAPMEEDAFFGALHDRMGAADAPEAVVYIHGYAIGFEEAARRAAQLAHDMNYPGVPVLYSWPSRGRRMDYVADAASVERSARRLSGFLDDLVARSGARTIHVVAHSMGAQALVEALELMALRRDAAPGDPPVLGQVVFAAPDVDADLFAEVVPTFAPLAERLTLYGSETDWALEASRLLHGDAPRAGQGGEALLALDGLDSVDMTDLGEDMLAHRYFSNDASALADLVALTWRNVPPDRRCGLTGLGAAGRAPWRFEPEDCPGADLLAVMSVLQGAGVESADEAQATVERAVTDPDVRAEVEPLILRMFGP